MARHESVTEGDWPPSYPYPPQRGWGRARMNGALLRDRLRETQRMADVVLTWTVTLGLGGLLAGANIWLWRVVW